ncbi:MAG: ParB/RepB/Spo0J family partition protein [Parvularculaceae bacterium]|nr:ParB/RepB/Spo0J family partition protein [Parvularculaceae bacterium]
MTTTAAKRPSGLGRGLDALLGDAPARTADAKPDANSSAAGARARMVLPIEFLSPGVSQPRRVFDDAAIDELAESIRARGLLQPILVRPISENRFEIVAGERRWRAAQKAGLHDVPVVIRELTDEAASEIALIENIQRVDLSPVEEARAYQRLVEQHKRSPDEIAKAVGKSRSHVANLMRLLALPPMSLDALERGLITMGHARAILSAPNPDVACSLVIKKGYSVRQIERIVAEVLRTKKTEEAEAKRADAPVKAAARKDADTRALEQELAAALGLEVAIEHSAKGFGVVAVKYGDLDQLDDLVRRLTGPGV